jgi:hypothetical protein
VWLSVNGVNCDESIRTTKSYLDSPEFSHRSGKLTRIDHAEPGESSYPKRSRSRETSDTADLIGSENPNSHDFGYGEAIRSKHAELWRVQLRCFWFLPCTHRVEVASGCRG